MNPTSAITVANFFIQKALSEGVPVTPMKVLKLVYISHGWHLALKDAELIPEAVQAWKHGPVVSSVYHKFKSYGNNAITSMASQAGKYQVPSEQETVSLLNDVWNLYKGFDGMQLSTLTHMSDSPWYQVFMKPENAGRQYLLIPNEVIKEHYKRKASGNDVIAC